MSTYDALDICGDWGSLENPYKIVSSDYVSVKVKDIDIVPSLYEGVQLNGCSLVNSKYTPITATAYKQLLSKIGVSLSTAKKLEGTTLLDLMIRTRLDAVVDDDNGAEYVFALAKDDGADAGYYIRGVSDQEPVADPDTVVALWSKAVKNIVGSRVMFGVYDTKHLWAYSLREDRYRNFLPENYSLLILLEYDDIKGSLNERLALRYFEEHYEATETMGNQVQLPAHKEFVGSFWRKGIIPCVEYRKLRSMGINGLSEKMNSNQLLGGLSLSKIFTPVIKAIESTQLFDYVDYPVLDMKARRVLGKKAYEQSNLIEVVDDAIVRRDIPIKEWLMEVSAPLTTTSLKKGIKVRHFIGDTITYITEELSHGK